MPTFEIKNRWTDAIIFTGDGEMLREVVVNAIASRANLSCANLYGANLSRADLYGADLSGANLYGANLSGANLSGANLYGANLSRANLSCANLYGANLSCANLSRADLYGANLSGANLSGANLYGADLSGANLSRADLSGANLSRANLYGAKGINPNRSTPLLMLLEQPGKIRAYKLVTANGVGPFNGGITYEIGKSYAVDNANTDVNEQCGAGINLATLDWCMAHWTAGYRILVAEFEAKDIAAIPTCTDGKFRVHRCTIVSEKDVKELGLIVDES